MRRLVVFNNVSLDGYFVDANGDMSWAHKQDPEWSSFVSENASGTAVLVFGRVTYGLMASYWPTPLAMKNSCGGRRDEQSSKGGVLENTGQGVVEEHQTGEGRLGGGSSEDEERIGAGYGDPGKREHCFAIGAGRIDRRIPGGAESHPAWKRQNHV